MDICAITKTQFYTLRDIITEDAIAILEIPRTACFSGDHQASLTMLMRYTLAEHYSVMEWKGEVNSSELEVDFKFHKEQLEQNATPSSVSFLVDDDVKMTLDPVSEHDAMNALILARLDYFRATEVKKLLTNSPMKVYIEYVGKLEIDGEFPRLIRHVPKVVAPKGQITFQADGTEVIYEEVKALPQPSALDSFEDDLPF